MKVRVAAWLLCAWAALVSAPAWAATLATIAPTTAAAAQVTTPLGWVGDFPLYMPVQCNFAYGSGGTSLSAWVQTSLDGGATWTDVMNCSFTTTSLRVIFDLPATTSITSPLTATDGTLAANTAPGGIFGQAWRVKWTSVGVYAGTTLTISVDVLNLK